MDYERHPHGDFAVAMPPGITAKLVALMGEEEMANFPGPYENVPDPECIKCKRPMGRDDRSSEVTLCIPCFGDRE